MNKRPAPAPVENIWDDAVEPAVPDKPEAKTPRPKKPEPVAVEREFDLEGLMTDFPTAKDL